MNCFHGKNDVINTTTFTDNYNFSRGNIILRLVGFDYLLLLATLSKGMAQVIIDIHL